MREFFFNEVENVRKMCVEIFGEKNFCGSDVIDPIVKESVNLGSLRQSGAVGAPSLQREIQCG